MKQKSDRTVVNELLIKHKRDYFYVKKALKRLGWGEGRIINTTDFLFKDV